MTNDKAMPLSRRDLLTGAASLGLAGLFRPAEAIAQRKRSKGFRFVHLTDLHLTPGLGAPGGIRTAVRKVLALNPRPDFVIVGGDHVFDAMMGGHESIDPQFRLVVEAMKPLEMPVYSVMGNHDVYGWGRREACQRDPLYGKRMAEEKFIGARTYRSFDFGGWHFALLDSIQPRLHGGWIASIDDDQLTWLSNDLTQAGDRPKVIVTHVPAISVYTQYTQGTNVRPSDRMVLTNGKLIQQMSQSHNVKAVLQGHTHAVEDCHYLGTKYVTSGAVCGSWWRGPHLGVHPEGFMVFDVAGDHISHRYVPYGFTPLRA